MYIICIYHISWSIIIVRFIQVQLEEVKEDQVMLEQEVSKSAVVDLENQTEELQALNSELEQLKEETKENEIIRKTETQIFHTLTSVKENKIDELTKKNEENERKIEKIESDLRIVIKERDIAKINLEIEVLKHKQKNVKNKRKIQEKLKEIADLKAKNDADRGLLENNLAALSTERDELVQKTRKATKEAESVNYPFKCANK